MEIRTPLRILVIDDEPFFLETLASYFRNKVDFQVVGTAENGRVALEFLESNHVDIALCDVSMPLVNGIEVVQEITRRGLDCKVLAITVHNTGANLTGMLQAGAQGFVLKSDPRSTIVAAAKAAYEGSVTISPSATATLRGQLRRKAAIGDVNLSPREREVLELLASGSSNAEIASELQVSVPSVKKAVSSLLQKYDVTSRTKLAATYFSNHP